MQRFSTIQPLLISSPKNILIVGASGAIGFAFYEQTRTLYPNSQILLFARNTEKLMAQLNQSQFNTTPNALTTVIELDLESPTQIEQACLKITPKSQYDLVFIASGWLHDKQFSPEKTWQTLELESLHKAYQINAVGPILFLKTLFKTIDLNHPMVIGVLSARVGSISDNRLGGWHSYRASKAALNMLIKNLAIELTRKRKPICIVGLQPGTTDSALSKPFQRHIPADQLQTATFTSQKLLTVLQTLTLDDSGKLFDFEGERFEP